MNEDPFSNREISEMFKDVKTSLDRIELQTTRTNGRVTKLEFAGEGMKGSTRTWLIIGIPLASFLVGYIGWLSVQVTTLATRQAAVIDALKGSIFIQ